MNPAEVVSPETVALANTLVNFAALVIFRQAVNELRKLRGEAAEMGREAAQALEARAGPPTS